MNNLRKAAESGATIYCVRSRDPKTGEPIDQRCNPARQVKKHLGLSGRQLKKLRKHRARIQREQARATAAIQSTASDVLGVPRRPPSPRPGPGTSAEPGFVAFPRSEEGQP